MTWLLSYNLSSAHQVRVDLPNSGRLHIKHTKGKINQPQHFVFSSGTLPVCTHTALAKTH
ncbi:hypothetical protein SERLADRAFT_393928, partial [Serpula lacrymans var. lacrymans S7.9]